MIGSNGPNISSFIIAESSGTSRKIVGAIFLRYDKNNRFMKISQTRGDMKHDDELPELVL
jgi:hypothetical protein